MTQMQNRRFLISGLRIVLLTLYKQIKVNVYKSSFVNQKKLPILIRQAAHEVKLIFGSTYVFPLITGCK